ncbi:transmembrane protein 164 [Exaiptasia diaphana]|uniref:Transmembrane protein 164 n=1 Tax=Exaiptasia diaphana TaxID=2652724 RepID=A0A913XRN8_EXADI|nr:transmembrane protein 164 [Exaiptasia diaphana]KXJ09724.1 Transmembrane protein 164 [Exaiptasia diaphana]
MLQLGWSYISDITYGGVNHSLPGNGGRECVEFLPPWQRLTETICYVAFAFLIFLRTLPKCRIPDKLPCYRVGTDFGKRFLLILLCLVFGIEVGFKVVTRQVIYLLNPCHVLSMVQIYLLIAPPSKLVVSIFRIQIYIIFGALLAVVFPVVNTRTLPCEVEVYWIQHILILVVVPFFLIFCKGPYLMEDLLDFNWATLTFSLYTFYMFLVLQPIGILSEVNLNSMICPAISDPFSGPYYRIMACWYIPALIFLVGKSVCVAGTVMLKMLDDKKMTRMDDKKKE